MTSEIDPSSFPSLRPAPGSQAPRREVLELPDGYRTVVYVHPAPVESAGLPVLYLHGIQSHPGWFVGSASDLARRGRWVYQVTRRGSGENDVARGHAASAGQLLADVAAACRFVRERTGAERLHLLGVSWGGKLLAAYAARASLRSALAGRASFGSARGSRSSLRSVLAARPEAQEEIASLTLVAPGIVPRVDLTGLTKLVVGASALLRPRREFVIPLGEAELFTENEPMQRYIREDRLSLRRATARFLLASRLLDWGLARAPRGAIRAPTNVLLASRDRIIDTEATLRCVGRLTEDRCKARRLEGAHTLEFESDPSLFYEALAAGIERVER